MAARKSRSELSNGNSNDAENYVIIPKSDPTALTTAALNREISVLRESLTNMIDSIKDDISNTNNRLTDTVKDVKNDFAAKNAPNYAVYVQMAGLILTLIGGFWLAGIQPIKDRMLAIESGIIDVNKELIAREIRFSEIFPTQLQFNEFKSKVDEVNRQLENENITKMSKSEFVAWKGERDLVIRQIQERLDRINTELRANEKPK